MTDAVLEYWPWVLPPVLGALIGYVTNSIAIKMLFRPLREMRVVGLRVPFTPGIIPKQRHELARSIGRMVSNQLLTEDVLRAQLQSERFQDGLRKTVSQLTERVLEGGRLSRELERERSDAGDGSGVASELERIVVPLLAALLRSPATHQAIASIVSNAGGVLGGRRLSELFGEEDRERLAELGARIVLSERVREELLAGARDWIMLELESDRTIGERIPPRFWVDLYRALDALYEPILEHVVRFLSRPDIRSEMSVRGKLLLQDVLDKLNLLQRLLISAGQYDRSLTENMPAIIDDLLETLEEAARDRSNRDKIVAAVVQAAEQFSEHTAEDALGLLGIDPEAARDRLLGFLESLLAREDVREQIGDFIKRRLDGARIPELGDAETSQLYQRLRSVIANGLAAWLGQGDTAERVARQTLQTLRILVKGRDQDSPDARVGALHWRRELAADKDALDSFLSTRVIGLLDARFNELIEAVDFERLVVEKIDSLEVERVERLLLTVIAKHLKWINLFGAMLGALIGLTQVILNLLA